MSDEMNENEFTTFTVTTRDGSEVEMAVVDEFEYKKRYYVAGALIVDDVVKDDEVYIYRMKYTEDDFSVIKIENKIEYQTICRAYMAMCEDN